MSSTLQIPTQNSKFLKVPGQDLQPNQNHLRASALNMFERRDKPKIEIQTKRKKKNSNALSLDTKNLHNQHQDQPSAKNSLSRPQSNRSRSQSKRNTAVNFNKQDNILTSPSLNKSPPNLDYILHQQDDQQSNVNNDTMEPEKVQNLKHAIQVRQERSNHSDFYILLEQVNDRIFMYKQLFLHRKPKYIKDQSLKLHQETSEERRERYIREQEEKERVIQLKQIEIKNKKNKFYDNLAKKQPSTNKARGSVRMVVSGSLPNLHTPKFQSDNPTDFSGLRQFVMSNQRESIEMKELTQEQIRKQKLYGTKLQAIGGSTEPSKFKQIVKFDFKHQNTDLSMIKHLPEDNSANTTQNHIQKMLLHHKNDISYLQKLQKTVSLPYLQHINPDTLAQRTPLQQYISERLNEDDSKAVSQKKIRKQLKLAEKKFKAINQKKVIVKRQDEEGLTVDKGFAKHSLDRSIKKYRSKFNIKDLPIIAQKLKKSIRDPDGQLNHYIKSDIKMSHSLLNKSRSVSNKDLQLRASYGQSNDKGKLSLANL